MDGVGRRGHVVVAEEKVRCPFDHGERLVGTGPEAPVDPQPADERPRKLSSNRAGGILGAAGVEDEDRELGVLLGGEGAQGLDEPGSRIARDDDGDDRGGQGVQLRRRRGARHQSSNLRPPPGQTGSRALPGQHVEELVRRCAGPELETEAGASGARPAGHIVRDQIGRGSQWRRRFSPTPDGQILIAFDGSPASRQAIVEVAGLSSDRRCVILTVSTPGNLGLEQFESDVVLAEERHIDAGDLDQPRTLSEKGVALAAASGRRAVASSLQTLGPAWSAIIDRARAIDAGLIAVGARNRHPIVDDILGSQTLKLLQHADVPVLVVRLPKQPTAVNS